MLGIVFIRRCVHTIGGVGIRLLDSTAKQVLKDFTDLVVLQATTTTTGSVRPLTDLIIKAVAVKQQNASSPNVD